MASELERLRDQVDATSQAIAALEARLETLEPETRRAQEEAASVTQELEDARAATSEAGFFDLLWERLKEGSRFLFKLWVVAPFLAVLAVVVALVVECAGEGPSRPFALRAHGTLVRSERVESLGARCEVFARRTAAFTCRVRLACAGERDRTIEASCVVEQRCEGSGDDETCWDAVVLQHKAAPSLSFDADTSQLDFDDDGHPSTIAVHALSYSGYP